MAVIIITPNRANLTVMDVFRKKKPKAIYIDYFLLNQIHFFSTESHIYYTTMTLVVVLFLHY